MPPKPRRGGYRGQRWQKKSTFDHLGSSKYQPGTDSAAEAVINRVDVQIFSGRDMQSLAFPSLVRRNNASRPSQGAIWKLKSDGKMNDRMVEAENTAFKEVLIHSSETKAVEADINRIGALTISENNQEPGDALMCSQSVLWKPKSDGIMKSPVVQVENAHADAVTENATGAEAAEADIDRTGGAQSSLQCHGSSTIESVADHENRVEVASFEENSPGTSNLLKSSILENSILGNLTFSKAEVKAAYYPKFESEHSEEQNRMKMIRMVSEGQASLEVSLKHSGLLFTYAGCKGGAYVGGSFGNIYTAAGVFVLGRTFCEAWGSEGRKKQAEFNDSLERDHMCVSMELVTAVLGDHGQRPQEDYVVVAAVTELHGGKPKFYTTPDIMAFCQEWRLPMNSVWLFSTRKSVTTFFAAYDALREEGTATSVCKVLDEVADLSLPGSIDYMKVQGEILEGLVARIVNCETLVHLEKVLKDSHSPSLEGAVDFDLGPSLREIFTANRSNEWQQMIELLHGAGDSLCPDFSDWVETETAGESVKANESLVSKFLEACPADFCTGKMQEMICLMRAIGSPVNIQCYHSYARAVSSPSRGLSFKMAIYGKCESAFRRYQQELRGKPGLWPFYRGIFLDVSLFKANKDNVGDIMTNDKHLVQSGGDGGGTLEKDGLADEDVNLMIKLGFLPYRLRASLIRNGLSILFKEGRSAYRAYYLRQMKAWGTSSEKQLALGKMLDEWSFYVRNLQLSPSMYLNEAEPFLKKYAERSRDNNTLVGYAGNLVTSEYFLAFVEDGTVVGSDENLARAENFLAICEDGTDKEVEQVQELAVLMLTPSVKRSVSENDCLIVFFPGMPGSAKSGLCREISNAKGGLGDGRQVHWLMGDYVRGVHRNYWKELTDECRKRRHSIILADKNVPNEEAWGLIENICKENSASAVPVVNDSEGTNSNPFSLSALAVFMSRVFQRDYHTGNLDKASPKAGFILLKFYHIHEGKNREAFECKLIERFGSLVKVPLLKSDRIPLPEPIDSTLQEGIKLYKLHNKIHPRLESLDGVFSKEWAQWEKKLQKVIHENSMYLNSIQVPFELMVMRALEQLRNIASGGSTILSSERQKFGSLALAAVSLPISDVQGLLNDIALKNPRVDKFLKDKHVEKSLLNTFVSLAHKRSHGVTAVASYGPFLHQKIPVDLTALLFSEEVAALEACLGSTDGESITSRDQWPHVTIWTKVASDAEANSLPQLVVVGKAIRIDIDPPASMLGTLELF